MKDNLRFVDSDMHVMEPPDLFERYLDPKFRDRVSLPTGADGRAKRGTIYIDGKPTSMDAEMQQYRKRGRSGAAPMQFTSQPLSGSRLQSTAHLDFAIKRQYDAQAQVMGMAIEGIDIAVLYPTTGLSLIARDGLDPKLSLALCQAYNNWIYEFCQYSPDQLKFVAMLPLHDVNLACQELVRCVKELGAVGSFMRPNLVNGHYWHSNYWDPLYSLHEELDVTWGFHEGTGAWYSHMNVLYGENRFYRHVASHWIEMQQALIAMLIGGVFEFHPTLRGFIIFCLGVLLFVTPHQERTGRYFAPDDFRQPIIHMNQIDAGTMIAAKSAKYTVCGGTSQRMRLSSPRQSALNQHRFCFIFHICKC